ncbi:MAG: hypothetical protein NC131_09935 [Roseburia sp.]|nr:hypothetical protein [Roseburia sp.]
MKVLKRIPAVIMVLILVWVMGLCIYHIAFEPPVIYEFGILELEPGVYGYRETSVSRVPAQNYTMLTLMDMNGNIFTIRGSVSVVAEVDRNPYAVWTHYKHVAGQEEVVVYAPPGSIKYLGAVGGR